jgi:hypothetical protein
MFECLGCGAVQLGRRKRKFCSNACQREVERQELVALWLRTGIANPGSGQGHYVRRYLAEQQHNCCALCDSSNRWNGAPLTFVLDHIDGDSTNNQRSNLRLICPNCDSQLPTYKARNRGRGRHARRVRYANGQSF